MEAHTDVPATPQRTAQAPPPGLLLDPETRRKLWGYIAAIVEDYIAGVGSARVSPKLDPGALREFVESFDFREPREPLAAVEWVVAGLWRHQVHTPHPRYFGLFNPAPTAMGIAADTLVAAFNPQLAAWSHSPLAAEIETNLVRAFGARFGYDPATADGTFASGGAEANHTALLAALVQSFPEFAARGVRALERQPVFYASSQSHHSFLKAARLCGLGTEAVRSVGVDADLRLDLEDLAARIRRDREEGLAPFFVVATAGTTNTGVIDPIGPASVLAAREGLWFHVDAAWGGAACLVEELRPLLAGIEQADSITFDAHKFLSVPMGAGLFLTRRRDVLSRTFGISTAYMPKDAAGLDVTDPHMHSIQWSRRFTGLKLFLSLAVAGWEGYAAAIRHQVAMGNLLRRELERAGWKIVNRTELPVVCFTGKRDPEETVRKVLASGRAWLSTTRLTGNIPVLRACITNFRTQPEDVLALVEALEGL
jgi:glutamate/tyrosine decarboxylase-like PLP-dependent enzyme